MAKNRRSRPRLSPELPKRRAQPAPVHVRAPGRPSPAPQPVPPPAPSPSHLQAVALYESGLEALQRHAFDAAAASFREVLNRYPEEREIHERARLYLKVCERQVIARPEPPRTVEERLLSATVALNSGDFDGALSHLGRVEAEDPENDHAQYMLAVIAVARGQLPRSIEHLRRAIELNPENRGLARQDADLEPLRGDESFRALVEPAPGAAPPRRRKLRPAR
ncbi:MAG TPA: tetratricopeptide repeat protein [Vicinamibacterales bacterium]|jgi:tetratricopeptide (TPR) repeat protein|nr:tetratricopeptide repeat protein [Vicinamibacterales bacterium]